MIHGGGFSFFVRCLTTRRHPTSLQLYMQKLCKRLYLSITLQADTQAYTVLSFLLKQLVKLLNVAKI